MNTHIKLPEGAIEVDIVMSMLNRLASTQSLTISYYADELKRGFQSIADAVEQGDFHSASHTFSAMSNWHRQLGDALAKRSALDEALGQFV